MLTWSVTWSVVQKFNWRKYATLLQNHKQNDSSGHENDIGERSNHEYMMIQHATIHVLTTLHIAHNSQQMLTLSG
jgi:hypothetical protein